MVRTMVYTLKTIPLQNNEESMGWVQRSKGSGYDNGWIQRSIGSGGHRFFPVQCDTAFKFSNGAGDLKEICVIIVKSWLRSYVSETL